MPHGSAQIQTSELGHVCQAPHPTDLFCLSQFLRAIGCRFPVSAQYEACSPIRWPRLFSFPAAVRPTNGLHPIPVRLLRLALGVTTDIQPRSLIPPSLRRPVGSSDRAAAMSTKAVAP